MSETFYSLYDSSYGKQSSASERLLTKAGVFCLVALCNYGATFITTGPAGMNTERVTEAVVDSGYTDPHVTEVNRVFPVFEGCGAKALFGGIGMQVEATTEQGEQVDLMACGSVLGDIVIGHVK